MHATDNTQGGRGRGLICSPGKNFDFLLGRRKKGSFPDQTSNIGTLINCTCIWLAHMYFLNDIVLYNTYVVW